MRHFQWVTPFISMDTLFFKQRSPWRSGSSRNTHFDQTLFSNILRSSHRKREMKATYLWDPVVTRTLVRLRTRKMRIVWGWRSVWCRNACWNGRDDCYLLRRNQRDTREVWQWGKPNWLRSSPRLFLCCLEVQSTLFSKQRVWLLVVSCHNLCCQLSVPSVCYFCPPCLPRLSVPNIVQCLCAWDRTGTY